MDEKQYIYRCTSCNAKKNYREDSAPPVCCSKPMVMEEVPVCISAPHAEMARSGDDNGPCDDGRGQQYTPKKNA